MVQKPELQSPHLLKNPDEDNNKLIGTSWVITKKDFNNTSFNPVIRTEIVGLHSSQPHPQSTIGNRTIHADCEMLTVNPLHADCQSAPSQGSMIGNPLFIRTVKCSLVDPLHVDC